MRARARTHARTHTHFELQKERARARARARAREREKEREREREREIWKFSFPVLTERIGSFMSVIKRYLEIMNSHETTHVCEAFTCARARAPDMRIAPPPPTHTYTQRDAHTERHCGTIDIAAFV